MSDSLIADSHELAREFAVPQPVMQRFIERFAPAHVPKDRFAERSDIMLFVHIPKTAGMSVGRSLQQCFDQFRGVDWNDVPKSFRTQTREACYRQTRMPGRQVIMGHFAWNEMQLWRNHEMEMKCGTILRDPLDRLVSNYNYNCSDAHPDNPNFRKRFPTLRDFARTLPYDLQIMQTIGVITSFAHGMEKFIRHYSFIGVTEQLPASLQHLSRSHGLPAAPEFRENVGKIPSSGDHDPELREIVEKRSVNDLRLHRLMQRLYAGG